MSLSKKSFSIFRRDILVYITSILTGAIIARTLGPAAMGIWMILLMIPSYAEAFGRLKFDIAAVYFLGKKKYSLGEVAFMLNIAALISSSIIILLYFINMKVIDFYLFKGQLDSNLFFLALLIIPFQFIVLNYAYLLLHLEDVKAYNFYILCQQFISQILAVTFLWIFSWGIAGLLLSTIIANLIALSYLAWKVSRIEPMSPKINLLMIKDFFSFSRYLYFSGLIGQLNAYVSGFLVAFYLPAAQVAYFRMGQDKASLLNKIPAAINTMLYPKISKMHALDSQNAGITTISFRVSFILMCVLAVLGVILVRPVVFILYGKEFLPLSIPFLIMLPGILLLGASSVFNPYFIGIGRPGITLVISLIPLIFQIALSISLIPILGTIGAALAVLFTFIAVSFFTVIMFIKVSKIKLIQIVPNIDDLKIILRFLREQLKTSLDKVMTGWKRLVRPLEINISNGGHYEQ